ncbi:glucose-6-phosphate isomerase [Pseudomarimonas salicorniae]|uniref:Glucose-6-phosphate isomerase n=1 Tax=Pseudomarimonas salicorniae TaxID=2933270 RepID=A0ABT0GMI9_9GAMM|nr:glucose-6-phosphate isomerase [Lysobacter sp. CAU 1642]MCK7595439.1 glucose-6-phosphate isomerase [Lysobacter sp. CAU 1642]
MQTQDWLNTLAPEAARLIDTPLPRLLAADPERAQRDALRCGPLFASFARQRLDGAAWDTLFRLAGARGLLGQLRRQLDGEPVNTSESRPALHTALRSALGKGTNAEAAHAEARKTLGRSIAMADALAGQGITDILNIGIGGSDLGPRLVYDALGAQRRMNVHFLSSPDGHTLQDLLPRLDPARTAVLLVSKSFGTEETLLNGEVVREWLGGRGSLVAATANVDKARAFGVDADNILPLWDWVGGRYSLWSAVGFALVAALGGDRFAELLAGAAEMDAHVASAAERDNLALRHALVAIWNRNALGYASQAVLPYDQRLRLLPNYLQQLVMESLGKSVLADGSASVACSTVPVLWGGSGTDCQHSFFQALHQGTDTVPAEFVGVARPDHGYEAMHRMLMANLLAQSEALANGVDHVDPHRQYRGSRPSTVILLDALTPRSLGALIALHEHSVFLQSAMWGINAFDQWGVELGKQTARTLAPAVANPEARVSDPVSAALIQEFHRVARG